MRMARGGLLVAVLEQLSANPEDAVKQALDVLGTGSVVDNANAQYHAPVNLRWRYQVITLLLDTVAYFSIEPIDFTIVHAGRSKAETQNGQLRRRDQFEILLRAYQVGQVLCALHIVQDVATQSVDAIVTHREVKWQCAKAPGQLG